MPPAGSKICHDAADADTARRSMRRELRFRCREALMPGEGCPAAFAIPYTRRVLRGACARAMLSSLMLYATFIFAMALPHDARLRCAVSLCLRAHYDEPLRWRCPLPRLRCCYGLRCVTPLLLSCRRRDAFDAMLIRLPCADGCTRDCRRCARCRCHFSRCSMSAYAASR